jgi:inhibitor of cysteine peptidase
LPENPTTGYRWTVTQADSRLLKSTSDDFLQSGDAVGGGGARVFRFTATGAGEASLSLALARSWESGTPRQQFSIRVRVQ